MQFPACAHAVASGHSAGRGDRSQFPACAHAVASGHSAGRGDRSQFPACAHAVASGHSGGRRLVTSGRAAARRLTMLLPADTAPAIPRLLPAAGSAVLNTSVLPAKRALKTRSESFSRMLFQDLPSQSDWRWCSCVKQMSPSGAGGSPQRLPAESGCLPEFKTDSSTLHVNHRLLKVSV